MPAAPRPKLAVIKFASCDGCQLSLLDCEDELLTLADRVHVANFLEASREIVRGPYDVTLVEGSITTPHDAERIHQVRRATRLLITIGACATAGGIQALRNTRDTAEWMRAVYPSPHYIETLGKSTPIRDHVLVDYELRGCPVQKDQLLEVLNALLHGRKPVIPTSSVCLECKQRGATCVMVAPGTPCLGPVTRGGCGALCPSFHRGCYGCFGPADTANTVALSRQWSALGAPAEEIARSFLSFNAGEETFRREGERHGQR